MDVMNAIYIPKPLIFYLFQPLTVEQAGGRRPKIIKSIHNPTLYKYKVNRVEAPKFYSNLITAGIINFFIL